MDSPVQSETSFRSVLTDRPSDNELSDLAFEPEKEDDENKGDEAAVKEDEEGEDEEEVEEDLAAELTGWESAHLLFLKTSFEDVALTEDTYLIQDAKAYSFLDIALVKGDVTETQRHFFRDKFNLFSEAYRTSTAQVKALCEQIRTAHDTLKSQRSLEEGFSSLPEVTHKRKCHTDADKDTDKQVTEQIANAAELRMQLLAFRNKLQVFEEQYERVDHMLRYLREEKEQLEMDLAKMDKNMYNEKAFKLAIQDMQALDVDILTKKRELEEITSNIAKVEKNIALEHKKIYIKTEIIEALERDLFEAKTKKTQHHRYFQEAFLQDEEYEHRMLKAHDESRDLYERLRVVAAQVSRSTAQLSAAKNGRRQEEARIEQRHQELEEVERKLATLKTQTAENKEIHVQMAHALHLNEVARHQAEERRLSALHDRDKRKCMLATAQLKCKQMMEQLTGLGMKHQTLSLMLETYPNENEKLCTERKKMADDIEMLNQRLVRENAMTTLGVGVYEKITKAVVFLQSEMWAARKHLHELTLTESHCAAERLRRFCSRAKVGRHLEQLKNQRKLLETRHAGIAKTLHSMELKMDELKKRVDDEKNERNKDYRQMLLEQQKLVEWKERLKVINTEIGNLYQLYEQRVRQLQRVQARAVAEKADRAALRAERVAVRHELRCQELEQEAGRVLVKRAKRSVLMCRRYGMMARDEFDTRVNERNTCALQLRDRTEEAAIFTEKMKTFDDMLVRADCEYMQRVEVVGRLRTVMACEQEDVHQLRRRTSTRTELAGTVDTLSCELYQVTNKEVVLEKVFESGSRHHLIGDGPGVRSEVPEQLKEKYFALERRLKNKEVRLVEIRLLHGQLSRIIAALQRDIPAWLKDGQLATQAKVKVQTKTDNTSRRMKTLICEVALARTTLRTLKQQAEMRWAELEVARRRMECGEAPTDGATREWTAMERRRTFVPTVLPTENCVPSPRPTAYIPNVQGRMVLHVPRPYGAYAPFKPFRPTPHLRHYRAPSQHKLDIQPTVKSVRTPGEGVRADSAPSQHKLDIQNTRS